MQFNVILLLFGAILLVVGLAGRIEAQRLKIGIEDLRVRIFAVLVGSSALILAILLQLDILDDVINIFPKKVNQSSVHTDSQNDYFVVVMSSSSTYVTIEEAKRILSYGYDDVRVYLTPSGFYAVTIKANDIEDAELVIKDILDKKIISKKNKPFISKGKSFIKPIFPE